MRAYLGYSKLGYVPHYWRSYDGAEVDILIETARGFVAIEVKAGSRWEKRFNRSLRRVAEDLGRGKTACIGVCTVERAALWDDVQVLPVGEFLERVWEGQVIAWEGIEENLRMVPLLGFRQFLSPFALLPHLGHFSK